MKKENKSCVDVENSDSKRSFKCGFEFESNVYDSLNNWHFMAGGKIVLSTRSVD